MKVSDTLRRAAQFVMSWGFAILDEAAADLKWREKNGILNKMMTIFFLLLFQVGSFNYDMSKMVFTNEFVPNEQDAIKSILDYEIQIKDLRPDQTHYVALGKVWKGKRVV